MNVNKTHLVGLDWLEVFHKGNFKGIFGLQSSQRFLGLYIHETTMCDVVNNFHFYREIGELNKIERKIDPQSTSFVVFFRFGNREKSIE